MVEYCYLAPFFSIFLILNYNLNKNKIFADEIFLVLFLPGIDLIRLIVIRFLKGKNIFEGDFTSYTSFINYKVFLNQNKCIIKYNVNITFD